MLPANLNAVDHGSLAVYRANNIKYCRTVGLIRRIWVIAGTGIRHPRKGDILVGT